MASTPVHTHPKDCPDRKAAATDRATHAAQAHERELKQQVDARATWFGAGYIPEPILHPRDHSARRRETAHTSR